MRGEPLFLFELKGFTRGLALNSIIEKKEKKSEREIMIWIYKPIGVFLSD